MFKFFCKKSNQIMSEEEKKITNKQTILPDEATPLFNQSSRTFDHEIKSKINIDCHNLRIFCCFSTKKQTNNTATILNLTSENQQ